MHRFRDADGLPSLTLMMGTAQVPGYGVSENPYGLKLRSTKYSFESRGPDSVELNFVSPGPVDPQVIVGLRSLRVGIRNLKLPPGYGSGPDADLALRLLGSYRRDLRDQIKAVSPQTITRHVVLPGFERDTEILNWPEPIDLFNFSLKNDEVILSVTALGLSELELLQLLKDVIVVNDRPDLLEQYDSELHEMRDLGRGNQQN